MSKCDINNIFADKLDTLSTRKQKLHRINQLYYTNQNTKSNIHPINSLESELNVKTQCPCVMSRPFK